MSRPDYGEIEPGSSDDIPGSYKTSDFPKPAITVDIVVLTLIEEEPHVLLIKRSAPPFKDFWALPGGFLNMDEGLDEAALRELYEETGLDLTKFFGNPEAVPEMETSLIHWEQLHTFGQVGRDPRDRIITVCYLAVIESDHIVTRAGDDAREAALAPVSLALSSGALAFDHHEMIEMALDRIIDSDDDLVDDDFDDDGV